MLREAVRAALATGAVGAAYALYEPYRFRLQRHSLEGRQGSPALNILHVSDLHLTSKDSRRAGFVRSVADRLDAEPDLVFATGDLLEDDSGIEPALAALEPLTGRLGRFYVLGSHDYYQSRFKSPTQYLTGSRGSVSAPHADHERLEAGLRGQGWVALHNRTEVIAAEVGSIRVAGVDDPYLGRQRTGHIGRAKDDVFAIGLTHSPDVTSEWALAGFDLVLAGHTHGGQLRLPYFGALVTNSMLPTRLAMGPSRVGDTWLHVSPGAGTSRYTPIRFLCRPEVTLLEMGPTF